MVSLPDISQFISIYGLFFILGIGTIGNLLNLITLSMKDFRKNASIFYLLSATITNQVFISFGVIARYFTESNGSNLINTNIYMCKLRNYLLIFMPLVGITCGFLASFDRCVSTSPNNRWRQLSSIDLAQRICAASILFLIISSSFCLFAYGIPNGTCTPYPGIWSIITNIYTSVLIFCIPIAGNSICGILTWYHLKKSRSRVQPRVSNNETLSGSRRMNRDLIILTFVQACLFTVTYALRWFTFDYAIATAFEQKSVLRKQIENLILQISLVFMYTSHSIPFYLNYLLCNGFRKTFQICLQNSANKCLRIFRFTKT